MFGFKKNEKPTLIIEAKDLMEIIKSDYDNDMAFTLIEFSYNEKKYAVYISTEVNTKGEERISVPRFLLSIA